MNTTRRRAVTAPIMLLLATLVATACVGYDPREYDGDVPSHLTSTATPGGPGTAGQEPGSHIVLLQAVGDDVTVNVADSSGTLVEATSGVPGDGASVESGQLVVGNDDSSTLRLTWTGGSCASDDVLLIDAARRAFVLGQRTCEGDALVTDRILILRFSEPIAAGDVDARVADGFAIGG